MRTFKSLIKICKSTTSRCKNSQ